MTNANAVSTSRKVEGSLPLSYDAIRSATRRELLIPVNQLDRYSSFLRLTDPDSPREEGYDVPLVSLASARRTELDASRSDQPGTRATILCPVVPLCYTTHDSDPQKVKVPRIGGRIYVFIDGFLWRELEVLGDGNYRDVNLHRHCGKDVRPATAESDNRIVLPMLLDGGETVIQMAFSEIPWSWERINSLGGMHEKDPRIQERRPPMPSKDEREAAASRRSKRMVWVFLDGYRQRFPFRPAVGNAAAVGNIAGAPDLYPLVAVRKDEIPAVYLPDPLGVARELAWAHQQAWREMQALLEDLSNPNHVGSKATAYPFAPWFKSALLANQYFFGPVPEQDAPGIARAPGQPQATAAQWQKARELRAKWQRQLSHRDIETALGTKERAQVRERILQCKTSLVEYLSTESPVLEELVAAFDDYLLLPANIDGSECAAAIYRVSEQLLAKVGDHAYVHDLALESDPPDVTALKRDDPGRRFLLRLVDPRGGHPLHQRLFPVPEAREPWRPVPVRAEERVEKADPASLLATPQKSIEYIGAFIDTLADAVTDSEKTEARDAVVRLINSSGAGETLEEAVLTIDELRQGTPNNPNYFIVSHEVVSANEALKETRRQLLRQDHFRVDLGDGEGPGGIAVLDTSGKLMGHSSVRAYRKGLGLNQRAYRRGEGIPSQLRQIQVRVVVARRMKGAAGAVKWARNAGALAHGVLPMVAALEVFNLNAAWKKLTEDGEHARDRTGAVIDMGSAMLGLASSVAGIIEQRAKMASAATPTRPGIQTVVEARVKYYGAASKTLGVAGGIYSGVVSSSKLMENLRQADDAAYAHGAIALGSILTVYGVFTGGAALAGGGAAGVLWWLVGGGWGLIGLAIVLAGTALLTWVFTEDSPLEEWLKCGPFSIGDGPAVREERIIHYGIKYRKLTELSSKSTLWIREEDGVLAHVTLVRGAFSSLRRQRSKIYRNVQGHWRHFATVGEPVGDLTFLMESTIGRFAGHKSGSEPKDKFGWWCERPGTAYAALADAIFRPVADLRCERGESVILGSQVYVNLSLHLPQYLEDTTKVFIELWAQEDGWVRNGDWQQVLPEGSTRPTIVTAPEGSGPRSVTYRWLLDWKKASNVRAKIRVDLYGDGRVLLPAFEAGKSTEGGPGLNDWIVVENSVVAA